MPYERYNDDDLDQTPDDNELEELADQIQVGDRSEGARALQRLVERAGANPEAISRGVRETLARERTQAEIDSAMSEFGKRHPKIANDPVFADAGLTVVRNEIARDFETIGIPAEKIEPIKGSNSHMIRAYADLRAAGKPVRAPLELLEAAAQEFRQRGIRTGTSRDPQEVIREMRAARGFSNRDDQIATVRTPGATADDARRERARKAIGEMRAARGFYDTYE